MDDMIKLGLIALGICITATITIPAFADGNNYISIFSSGCKNCPNIYELIEYDTSDQEISGKFVVIDNSTVKTFPQKDEWRSWYNYFYTNSTIVFVEPQAKDFVLFKAQVKNIKIVQFFQLDRSNAIINGTTTHTENRNVSNNCHDASISATWSNGTSAWRFLLEDTITYLAHNCDPAFTVVNSTVITHHEIKKQPPSTPYGWVHKGTIRMVTLAEWCFDKYPCPEFVWDSPEWAKTVLTWYNDELIDHNTFDRYIIWLNENDIVDEYPYHESRR